MKRNLKLAVQKAKQFVKKALKYCTPYVIVRAYQAWRFPGLVLTHPHSFDVWRQRLAGIKNKFKPLAGGSSASVYELPADEQPDVSIILPVYNHYADTCRCLQSIVLNSQDASYEVILADDCSTDETVRIAKVFKNIRINRTEKNLGFLRNCNAATGKARGKYILFLNNDTQVHPRWLSSIIKTFEAHPKAGAVGSKLLFPDGSLQEAGGIVWRDGTGCNYGRGDDPSLSEYCYLKECDYISGAALAVRADLWRQIGGFDERFAPAYYEDTDLCFEIRKRGFVVLLQPESQVTHFEGVSNGTSTTSGIKSYQVVNHRKFVDKWDAVLKKEHCDAKDKFLARDRSMGKRHVFLIDECIPIYDHDAGSRQICFYVKTMCEMGYMVHLLGDNAVLSQPYGGFFQQLGVEVLYGNRFADRARQNWFRENGRYINIAFLHRPYVAIWALPIVRLYTNAKVVFFGADIGHIRHEREYALTHDEAMLPEIARAKKLEDMLYSAADVNLCVGGFERQYLASQYPSVPVYDIPLFVYKEFRKQTPPFPQRCDIMFVGGFLHKPNVDAVLWFAKDILPRVQEKIQGVRLHVVGSNAPDEVKKLASDAVIVEGFLEDSQLVKMYDSCRLTVAPLRFGAGVKGKIVDALYFGSVVVTTSIGAEGIPAEPPPFLVADTEEAFADAVVKAYTDEQLWNKLRRQAWEIVTRHYSQEVAESLLKEIFAAK